MVWIPDPEQLGGSEPSASAFYGLGDLSGMVGRQVVGENSQLLHKGDVANLDVIGDAEHGRGEVEYRADVGVNERVSHALRCYARYGDDCHMSTELLVDLFDLGEILDFQVPEVAANLRKVIVENGDQI